MHGHLNVKIIHNVTINTVQHNFNELSFYITYSKMFRLLKNHLEAEHKAL